MRMKAKPTSRCASAATSPRRRPRNRCSWWKPAPMLRRRSSQSRKRLRAAPSRVAAVRSRSRTSRCRSSRRPAELKSPPTTRRCSTMGAPIEFYFDFSSPYGYVASTLADGLGERLGREILWRPFLLGPVFKANGMAPLVDVPMKGDYSKHDFNRTARYYGVPFSLPAKFPIGAIAALRSFYWIDDRDPAKAKAFAKAVYKAYFVDGLDIGGADVVVPIAKSLGVDGDALAAALNDPAVK